MFCPRCGQEQISAETRFCSRCGFLMTGVNNLLSTGGALPEYISNPKESARKKGLKQGGKMLLAGMILVPILGVFAGNEILINEFIVGLTAIITFWGGILRMLYALVFEGSEETTLEQKAVRASQKLFNKESEVRALPPQQSTPVSSYVPPQAGSWRETKDLVQPSVTEETTKFFNRENE